jgi:hypothetical protein
MRHTIEEHARLSSTDTPRGRCAYGARGEPSHIHLPRRRRAARPDDQGTGIRYVFASDLAPRGLGEPASLSAEEA